MTGWTPRSERLGKNDYSGPYEGIPDHLKPQLSQWLFDALTASTKPEEAALAIALKLRLNVGTSRGDPVGRLIQIATDDDDLMWDVIEGALRVRARRDMDNHLKLEGLLNHGGSVYKLSDDLLIIERVGAEAQAVHNAAIATPDHVTENLRQAWSKAYGRSPDPSDAWTHATKAIEAVLQPVVEPKNETATLSSIIGALNGGEERFKSAFAGPTKDNSVEALVATLRLVSANAGSRETHLPQRKPTLQEARAVVNLVAALVQCEHDGYLVALR